MPDTPNPRFLPSGDTALVIEFGERIDRDVSARVLALAERIEQAAIEGISETVPTFRSLMVHFDPLRLPQAELRSRLAGLLRDLRPGETAGRLWRIPACYDPSLGPDLAEVAERTGLSVADVIAMHSGETYHVYMVGFLPAFPYMGDLPAKLALPRRENPRVKVPAGSIAIAMAMTSIYTLESPGGWHLLGRTPAPLWDLGRPEPALLRPGDKVRFDPIPVERHHALLEQAAAGSLLLEPEALAAAEALR